MQGVGMHGTSADASTAGQAKVDLRTELRPGDVGWIVQRHGAVYARETGFDATFEAYVAAPLAETVLRASPRDRIWIAHRLPGGEPVGCIKLAEVAPGIGQLRWFLVDTPSRGTGLGRLLLDACLAFSRSLGHERVVLWTVAGLPAAAHLYAAAGFRLVESVPARRWGCDVVEEKRELVLGRVSGSDVGGG